MRLLPVRPDPDRGRVARQLMDRNSDSEVLRAAVNWLDEGAAVTLVTVARTWGSAPRCPGALMVIHADGRFVGSVSGGCVEDDLVQRTLRGEFERQPPGLVEYGVNTATARRVGLPSGGRLQLVVEYLDAAPSLRIALSWHWPTPWCWKMGLWPRR